ncbi:hypothetical protein [Aneurinibacillus tyrosinisolvens]|uniref:hypothetical protein n=1 Tax=Aneurinibacillus tyrosinisolvens TaxID=1443435 RepID=UPI00063FB457|nr:hypothetical protein [Aneurinibacillus tyrosinisolvens]
MAKAKKVVEQKVQLDETLVESLFSKIDSLNKLDGQYAGLMKIIPIDDYKYMQTQLSKEVKETYSTIREQVGIEGIKEIFDKHLK